MLQHAGGTLVAIGGGGGDSDSGPAGDNQNSCPTYMSGGWGKGGQNGGSGGGSRYGLCPGSGTSGRKFSRLRLLYCNHTPENSDVVNLLTLSSPHLSSSLPLLE